MTHVNQRFFVPWQMTIRRPGGGGQGKYTIGKPLAVRMLGGSLGHRPQGVNVQGDEKMPPSETSSSVPASSASLAMFTRIDHLPAPKRAAAIALLSALLDLVESQARERKDQARPDPGIIGETESSPTGSPDQRT